HAPSPCLAHLCRLTPPSTHFPYTTLFRSFRLSEGGFAELGKALAYANVVLDLFLPVVVLHLGVHETRDIAHAQMQDHYWEEEVEDRKSTRLNSSHVKISYAVFCLKKKKRT